MLADSSIVTTWHFLDNLNEGVLVVQVDGDLLYMNSAAYQLLGISEQPNSLADLYALIAPQALWQHLLQPPSESYLYLPTNNLQLESCAINWGSEELVQILIDLAPITDLDQSKPAATFDQLQALTRIIQKLNATLNLDDILQSVLNEAILITRANGGQIYLRDLGGSTFDNPHLERGQVLPARLALPHCQQTIDGYSQVLFHNWNTTTQEIQAMVVVPIIYAQETAGLLCLYGGRRNHFARQIQTFLTTIGNHAALAIGNAHRFQEIQERNILLSKRAEQTEQFVESSRIFHSNKTLEEVYEDLVYAIQEGIGFNIILLSLIEENDPNQTLYRVTGAGLPLERLQQLQQTVQQWAVIEKLAQPAFALGRAYFVPAENHSEFQVAELYNVSDLYNNTTNRRQMQGGNENDWHPDDIFFIMMYGSNRQPLGMISLDAPITGTRPDLNTAKALEIFANQAAIAIENIRLYNNTREYANHLQNIHVVSQEILLELSFDKKLQLIANGMQGIGWERVTLTLRDEQLNPLKLVSAGLTAEEHHFLENNMLPAEIWRQRFQNPTFLSHKLGSGYFISAEDPWGKQNIPITLPDHTKPRPLSYAWHPHDLFCLPLYDQQQHIIALIGLDQPYNRRRPDQRALQILDLYTRFASSVIENSRLFGETLARTQELEILYQAIGDVSSSLDQEKVLTAMGQHMMQAVYADGYAIYEWDLTHNQLTLINSLLGTTTQTTSFKTVYPLASIAFAPKIVQSRQPFAYPAQQLGTDQLAAMASLPSDNYTIILLPIIIREEVFGLVQLATRETWDLHSNEIKLLQAIINQASVALENARLFRETSQREQFFAALGRVSLAINATLDLPTVLDLICQESLNIFQVDGVYIWQRESFSLKGVAAQGFGKEEFMNYIVPASETRVFSAAVVNHGNSIFINHLPLNTSVTVRLPQKEQIQAILGVPLRREESIIGVLVLVDKQNPNRFSQQDIDLTNAFAVQATIAIQNAQLVTELRELNEQLDQRVDERTHALGEERDRIELLLRITSELSASLDEQYVLNRALSLINEVAYAPRGGILLIDSQSNRMVYKAAFGLNRTIPPEGLLLDITRDEGLSGWIIKNRASVLINDTQQDSRWIDRPQSQGLRSVLAVPLIAGDEVIGVLMLFHENVGAFTGKQLELVEAAAYQVANALYNAQLYVLIREQTEKLGKMLREEQIEAAKNQAILESIADGVLVADSDGNIILANRATSLILDLPRLELEGKQARELLGLYGASGDIWIRAIQEWAENPNKISEDTVLSDRLTIEDQFVNVTLSPVLAGGQFFGTVSIFRDVTKEVEVDRVKSEFVSTVSHELRTPMTSIKGYADLILMGVAGPLAEPQSRYLQVIKNNADRLTMLVNDLLDISRFETGKTELDLRALDIPQLIDQVVKGHLQGRIQHERKAMSVLVEIEPALPLVQGDHARVTQILNNLLDNAFNYTGTGGTINVQAKADKRWVFVSVMDTGIGISEENQKKIFDRFFRADDAQVQAVAGTGLGLAIVRSLVEMHGGKLGVQSRSGKGSTFTFSLPAVTEDGDV